MKKVKKFIKSNIKVVIAFILVISIAGSIGVYASTVISASSVSFSGSTSGLTSTNMQDRLIIIVKQNVQMEIYALKPGQKSLVLRWRFLHPRGQ